jgi:multiple sugar transport system ATP-binding protein
VATVVFDHVTKRYADGVEAVHEMNLSVADGEFMILVGPSGSGKSTALRMVAGLEAITEGEISIGDEVVNQLTPRQRDVAMVFQNYALYPHMTVRENMGFALKLAKVPHKEIDRKVQEAARILDVERHLDRKPAMLSGGQRQRVAMGRAIVRNPKVLLLDEPLSNLDAKLRVQTRDAIARLHQRFRTTTVYVTHDQTEALTLGDRIAVMRAGRIQQVGSPTDLYEHPANIFVGGFIGSPAMNLLPGELDGDRLRIAIGDVHVPDSVLRRLERQNGASGGRTVTVGIRPEHFEDAKLVGDRGQGHVFKAKIDVLEDLGSDYYAHFTLDSARVPPTSAELLGQNTGVLRVAPSGEGVPIVARLDSASAVRQGEEAEFWVDTSQLYLFDPESGRSLLASDLGPGGRSSAARGVPAAAAAQPPVRARANKATMP